MPAPPASRASASSPAAPARPIPSPPGHRPDGQHPDPRLQRPGATKVIGNDAFQEADVTGITRPCTKWNYLVKDVRELPRVVNEAFLIATSGRPGPVLVDLPKDVTTAICRKKWMTAREHMVKRRKHVSIPAAAPSRRRTRPS
jgi:hypothetical protein